MELTFEIGEIRYSKMNENITDIPRFFFGLAITSINNLKCNDRTPGPYQRLIVAQIPLGDRGLAFPLAVNMTRMDYFVYFLKSPFR